jgi:hypothetical protein
MAKKTPPAPVINRTTMRWLTVTAEMREKMHAFYVAYMLPQEKRHG